MKKKTFIIPNQYLIDRDVMNAFSLARSRVARKHGVLVDETEYRLNIKPEKIKDKSIRKVANAGRQNQLIAKNIAKRWKMVSVKDSSHDVSKKAVIVGIQLLAKNHKKRKVTIKDIEAYLTPELLEKIWEIRTNHYLSFVCGSILLDLTKKGKAPKTKKALRPK